MKYIDDLSLLQAINLKDLLLPDIQARPFPLTYNERTAHVLNSSRNPLQQELLDLEKFAERKLLRIKEKNTNLMKFSFSKTMDFPPEVSINAFKITLGG